MGKLKDSNFIAAYAYFTLAKGQKKRSEILVNVDHIIFYANKRIFLKPEYYELIKGYPIDYIEYDDDKK